MKHQADGEGFVTTRARGRPLLKDVAQIQDRPSPSQIVKPAAISKTKLYSRYDFKDAPFRAITHRQVERLGAAATLAPSLPMDLSRKLIAYANRTLAISLVICWP